jgi:hypothetical protein
MTNGWPAPASQKLGANWVEVTVWERVKRRFNQRRNDLKTWPATTRRFRSGSDDEHARGFQVGVAFPNLRGAAGVGQPFVESFDFRFAISDLKNDEQQANQKSAIKNRE